MTEEMRARVLECGTLPTLPSVALKVLQLTSNPNVRNEEVSAAISKDPALAAKVLHFVNSAFVGLRGEVTTISHAVVLLGIATVRTIVLGCGLMKNASSGLPMALDHKAFWKRSLVAATAGREIVSAQYPNGHEDLLLLKEEGFLAGLLQDMGLLVLDQVMPAETGALVNQALRHCELPRLEQERYGTDHAEVGAWLADRWSLPKAHRAVIRWHHDPESCDIDEAIGLVRIAAVADLIAESMTAEVRSTALAQARLMANRNWGFRDETFIDIVDWVAVALPGISELFEIDLGDGGELATMIHEAKEQLSATPMGALIEEFGEELEQKRRAA